MLKFEYKNYLLFMLMLVGSVSFFDRFVFALALEPIKQDLDLSDGQLGLLTGLAFTAFYAIAGIPIARWADKGNRVNISSITVGALGLMVCLCGFASNFIQLLLARAGVAIGEAGSTPTAQSLIADYFDRSERPQAMAIYVMCYSISAILGYLVGGLLIDALGWRVTFMLIGIPAIVVALVVKFTLHEPREKKLVSNELQGPSLSDVLKVLWAKPTYRNLLMAFCVAYFFLMGSNQWLAVFFMRSHGMSPTELGAWLALAWGVFGVLGNYIGGYCATRYAPGREKLQLRASAIIIIVFGFINAAVYWVSNVYVAIAIGALSALVGSLPNGAVFSSIQSSVNVQMRSVGIMLILLFANLIGFGLGPLAIGVLSDFLHPFYGDDSLRYALLLFSPGALWIAFYYWKASMTIEEEIVLVESSSPQLISGTDSDEELLVVSKLNAPLGDSL